MRFSVLFRNQAYHLKPGLFVSWVIFSVSPLLISGCADKQPLTISDLSQSGNISQQTVIEVEQEAVSSTPVAIDKPITLTPEGQRLVLAARFNQIEVVKHLINRGVDINVRDELGNSPLIVASAEENKRVIQLLLANNADVNLSAFDGTTALMAAARKGSYNTVRTLINHGAEINARRGNGETALIDAINYGYGNIVQLLLDKGANPNIRNTASFRNHGGFTPLMYAANHGLTIHSSDWLGIINRLLKAGADPNIARANGESALTIAEKLGDEAIVSDLRSAGARDQTPYAGLGREDSLLKATKINDEFKVREILESGGDPNYRDEITGITPLLTAVYYNHQHLAHLLIEAGADINKKTLGLRQNRIASSSVSVEDRELMTVAAKEESAIITAVRNKSLPLVRLLLENNANANVINKEFDTPTQLAVDLNQPEILRILLSSGADANRSYVDSEANAFIFNPQQESKNSYLLHLACRKNYNDIVGVLLNAGANPSLIDSEGTSPLLIASESGSEKIVDQLLKQDVDVNFMDKSGRTALMLAAKNGYKNIVNSLLEHQADTNIVADQHGETDDDAKTALIYATRGGHTSIVLSLLKYGADAGLGGDRGETALDIARVNGHDDLVKIFTDKF
ncbi:MAG: ankyrin repeat domain-containing protein [Gammaproteobacteria bacterium]